jgi:hypothetical protein
MTGNEYIWGFGQVGAVVALFLSFSNAFISYGGMWCIVLLRQSSADWYIPEHKKQQARAKEEMRGAQKTGEMALNDLPLLPTPATTILAQNTANPPLP